MALYTVESESVNHLLIYDTRLVFFISRATELRLQMERNEIVKWEVSQKKMKKRLENQTNEMLKLEIKPNLFLQEWLDAAANVLDVQ